MSRGFGVAVPRTGWGHSGHAPPLDLAWQTPTEVSEPGLPPWEILDGWVLRCPGERRGLPGAATLGGDVAPDGSGVTPLGSGRNSPPSGDLSAVCSAGGAERLPQLPLYPACAQVCPRRAQGSSSVLGWLFYSCQDLGQQEPEVSTGSTAEMDPVQSPEAT